MRYFEIASRLIIQEPNKDLPGYGIGLRHIQILLQFSMAFIFVAMNLSLPITIVAMTTPRYPSDVGITVFPNWTDQSLILVATQCGYAVTQLFGTCVSFSYGFNFVMTFSMVLCSIFCVLLPILTENFGSQGIILCLLLQGASQGFVLPIIPDYLEKWVPTSEKSSIGSLMYAANALGAALATKFSAYLSTSFLGWTFVYYSLGALGFVWSYLMLQFGKNAPENCEDISAEEREFIRYENKLRDKVPWKKILNSPALLAIWAAHAGTFWTLWLMTAEIPTYLSQVLKFSIEHDGDIVSNAYFMSWLFSFIMSGLTTYLIASRILSLTLTRKIAQSIASYLSAVCLIILGFISDPTLIVFFLTTIYMALTASFWGFMLNYNDIGHNRGIISKIGGFVATITTICPAILKQFIISDQSSRIQWSIMFWISAGVAILSNTAYFFYSSGDQQEWNSILNVKDVTNESELSRRDQEVKYLVQKNLQTSKDYFATKCTEGKISSELPRKINDEKELCDSTKSDATNNEDNEKKQ